eukprot:1361352-Amphidinium_carterae.1
MQEASSADVLDDEIADATVKQYKVQWWSLLICCGALSIAKKLLTIQSAPGAGFEAILAIMIASQQKGEYRYSSKAADLGHCLVKARHSLRPCESSTVTGVHAICIPMTATLWSVLITSHSKSAL